MNRSLPYCFWLAILVSLCSLRPVFSQTNDLLKPLQCGTASLSEAQKKQLDEAAQFALAIKKAQGKLNPGITYVPIRLHVFRRANGTGNLSMAAINRVFATVNSYYLLNGSGMQFYFAGTGPDYIDDDDYFATFPAFNEAIADGRDATNAMNMYLVDQFDQSGLGGYAYFPANLLQATRSFILTGSGESESDLGNRLIPHELGHNFQLYHTFEGSTSTNPELVTRGTGANCTTAGDRVCDTPADPAGRPGASTTSVNGCQVYNGTATDPTGAAYTPSISNIMSYYFPCTHDFTPGQYDRAEAGLALRQSHTAYSLNYPSAPVTPPSNLTYTASPRGYVQLAWRDNSDSEMGFFVERSLSASGGFSPVGGVGPDITTFTDQTINPGTTYYYRIRPSNTTNLSLSNVLVVPTYPLVCRPTYTTGCTTGYGTYSLRVGADTLTWMGSCPVTGYAEQITRQTSLLTGTPYSFTLVPRSGLTTSVRIWADLNRNRQYESLETLFTGTATTSPLVGTLTIPASVSAGPIALRVMTVGGNTAPNDPCGSHTTGETADYAVQVQTNCPQPGSLTTTAINAVGAQISWSGTNNGIRFDLQWQPQGATTWTTVAGLTSPTYSLTGLQPGTSYLWRVQAFCVDGSSTGFSGPVSFSTASTCPAPTGLRILQLAATTAQVGWQSVGPGVSYDLSYQAAGSLLPITLTGLTTTSVSLTGLAFGTAYSWTVQTNCGLSGTGPASSTFITRCLPPTSLSVLNASLNAATLSWNGMVARYDLQYRASTSATWTTISNINSTTYTLTGLQQGFTYKWQVRAACSSTILSVYVSGGDFNTGNCRPTLGANCTDFDGLNSFIVNGIPLSTSTGCNTGGYSQYTTVTVNVLPSTTYSFSATLLSQTYEEGVAIWADLNRNQTFEPSEKLYETPRVVRGSLAGNLTIPPNTAGGLLRVRVLVVYNTLNLQPCGSYGYGEAEDYQFNVTSSTACIPPTVSLAGPTSVLQGQTALLTILQTGSVPYSLTIANSLSNTQQVFNDLLTPTYSFSVVLSNTTTYSVVSVSNACGTGTVGSPVTVPVTTTCATPYTYYPTVGPTNAILQWQDIGAGVRYNLVWQAAGSPTSTTVSNLTTSSYSLTGLTTGTAYTWQIQTVCTDGNVSGLTSAGSFTTQCSLPRYTSQNTASSNSIYIEWGTSGDPTTRYDLVYRVVGAPTSTTIASLTSTNTYIGYAITGLMTSTAYEWQVRARCADGSSSAFTTVRSFTTTSCGTTSLNTPTVGQYTASLSWQNLGTGVQYNLVWQAVGSPT